VLLPLQHEVPVDALESFGDFPAIAVPNVSPMDVEVVLEVGFEDLEFTLGFAVIGFRNSLLRRGFIRIFVFGFGIVLVVVCRRG